MPHLWIEDTSGEWAVVPLEKDALDVTPLLASLVESISADTRQDVGRMSTTASTLHVTLLRNRTHGSVTWVLLAAPDAELCINGIPFRSGIRVLCDRDEIRGSSERCMFFSTESLAEIESLPITEQGLFCPRCKQALKSGAPAIGCPACGLWHHQSEELPCWTYSETCALCPQPTALDAGFRWTPEEL